jgi:hypothetical protein
MSTPVEPLVAALSEEERARVDVLATALRLTLEGVLLKLVRTGLDAEEARRAAPTPPEGLPKTAGGGDG